MNNLAGDVRSGLRLLVKYPTLSLVAVLTLGLGIGLGTTVFCVVNAALFKGLPFPDADRIVAVVTTNPGQRQPQQPVNGQDLAVWQARQTAFERIGAYGFGPVNLSTVRGEGASGGDDGGRPERFNGGLLTVGAFEAIGVQPALGRGFRAGDDAPGAEPVIIIGHRIWRERFARSPDIIGKSIRANGVFRTVIGVMPEHFGFPILQEVWTPLVMTSGAAGGASLPRDQGPFYPVVGRLKPGASIKEARTQAATIASQLEQEFPNTNKGVGANVLRYSESIFPPEIFALLVTMLAAGLGVMLIACVNVSNLLVARALMRRHEIAVRMALGAGRGRVVRQQLTEVFVLAALGGALGVVLAVGGVRWFTQTLSVNPPPFWITFDLDVRVMLFVSGLIGLATFAAGALPAIHATRVTPGAVLKDDSRGTTSAGLGRVSSGLVIAELAVSCGLLIAAGLMVKSIVQVKNVQMPFAIEHVLTARVDLPRDHYPDSAASIRFFEALLPKLRAVPGIESVTLSDGLPAAGNGTVPVQIEGKAYPNPNDTPIAREGIVTEGYFETFQVRIKSGREFAAGDTSTSPPVAIVNESFARLHFPGVDPVGHQMKKARPGSHEPWLTIVGVVPDLVMEGIGNNNSSPVGYYIPIAQSDVANGVRIAVRTRGDAAAMTPLVRAAVAGLDGDLALYDVRTMKTVIEQQTVFYTIFGTFFMAFGFCALFLAAAGLYGVMSFAVTQRTREMGVRSALGAQGAQLIALIMRKSVVQLAIGLAAGLALALAVSGFLQPVLYHVNPRDAAVFAGVVATLTLASLSASFLPALRVTRIDPVRALTSE
jgi:predicted permease